MRTHGAQAPDAVLSALRIGALIARHYKPDKTHIADTERALWHRRMTDPKQVRLNDAEDPDRALKFARTIKRIAGNGNGVIRELVDALIRYVDEHGHGPSFPVEIVPRKAPAKSRRSG